jgi:hypothetical protein
MLIFITLFFSLSFYKEDKSKYDPKTTLLIGILVIVIGGLSVSIFDSFEKIGDYLLLKHFGVIGKIMPFGYGLILGGIVSFIYDIRNRDHK